MLQDKQALEFSRTNDTPLRIHLFDLMPLFIWQIRLGRGYKVFEGSYVKCYAEKKVC